MFHGKSHLKNDAILLRQSGYSYSLIKSKIGVSKSTLCDWLKNIPFIPNKETLERMSRGRVKSSLTLTKNKEIRIENCSHVAIKELGKLTKRDLMLLGIGLYIGEGAKGRIGTLQFSNSDPKYKHRKFLYEDTRIS